MDKDSPQDNPGACKNELLTHNEAGEGFVSISSDTLEPRQKDASSHILFLTVEYVGEPPREYNQAYSTYHHSTMSPSVKYENCVSPLDPNLGCTARYSPVYISTEDHMSPDSFRNRVVILPRSPSPVQLSPDQIHSLPTDARHINGIEDECHAQSHSYITELPCSSPSLANLTPVSTSNEEHRNLIVLNETYFKDHADAIENFIITSNGIVCHSSSTYHNEMSVSVEHPENKGSFNELLISPTSLHNDNQTVMQIPVTESGSYPIDIDHRTVMVPHDKGAKSEQVHLLINSEDLPEVTRFMSSAELHGDLLSPQEKVHLDTVLDTLEMQILEKDMQNHPTPRMDSSHLHENIISEPFDPVASSSVTPVTERTTLMTDVEMSAAESFIVPDNYTDFFENHREMMQRKNMMEEDCETLRRSKRIASHMCQSLFTDKCCEECDLMECPLHHIQTITDKPVLSRAWATLPASYLAINKVEVLENGNVVYGVFARKTIPKRTQFGPVEGILLSTDSNVCNSQVELLVETETGALRRLDVSDENVCNWMRFVRLTRNAKEQNLLLNQQGHSLYFTTIKVIHPRQELFVGYSSLYATKRNLPCYQLESRGVVDIEQLWPCFECSEKFLTSDELQKHLNIHDSEKPDKPSKPKSTLQFRRKGCFRIVSKRNIIGFSDKNFKYPYQCNVCHKSFPRNYSLKRHVLLHTTQRKHTCEHCGTQFSLLHNKNRHVKKHHKPPAAQRPKSPTYTSVFKKKPSAENNNVNTKEWSCSHCPLTFDNSSVLNLHTLTHAAENLEALTGLPSDFSGVYHAGEYLVESGDLQCPQCTEEFPNRKDLIQHVTRHGKQQDITKPWKCELCYKSFATEERVKQHLLVHGSEDLKPLECNVCKKRFLNNSALACHLKTHTEKKMFECPICKEAFDQVLELKEHAYSHCKNGIFTCPQCKKTFEEYSLIRKHIRAFHCERKHRCNYCAKLFPSLDKLRMHMLRHSDHREFLCANCGKQFKRKDKLKEHTKRMHSTEKESTTPSKGNRSPMSKKFMPKVSPSDYHRFIYKCHPCQVGFKRRGMLVNHLANRHPEISPTSVPELNLPILKTTRDYYCQYCDKVYKSSSKRKAHILKNHPGAALPLSNRRKGGVPDIPGIPNPTFSQTVGSVTTAPQNCQWCHKQYASKAKLLQHQRKKHVDKLPEAQQVPRTPRQQPSSPESAKHRESEIQQHKQQTVEIQLHNLQPVNIQDDYHAVSSTEETHHQENGIVIDASAFRNDIKEIDGLPLDLLSQAVSELNRVGEFQVTLGSEHIFKIVTTSTPSFTPCTPR